MQNNLNTNEKYELLISTLNMVIAPVKEINVPYSDTVQSNLEELEGDYYTFLNQDYVEELFKLGMVSEEGFGMIMKIRTVIDNIEQNKWNVKDFLNDKIWMEVRKLTIELFLTDLK
ncbi:hypothetical protein LZQ00_05745 [Sphingobacterium sp. SRCM116780]|uniref:hypothetical protein n=1 Tax=Sphingobacterium sp. SRCM116780 TaxID=2907623 RepID=UPI001F46F1FF|nr:hypothetical protein [Sphingobacterium sp. SRCM116780]UIR57317.1 hypothetical protein LZQ00_05745 [Sphingobacterium sp. SRCM116780]